MTVRSTVKHLWGHGTTVIRCVLRDGTNETLTVLGKAQDIANSKVPGASTKKPGYLHTQVGRDAMNHQPSMRTLAGYEAQVKIRALPSQLLGHYVFRQNSH